MNVINIVDSLIFCSLYRIEAGGTMPRLDFNLLTILDAVIGEGSVSRAATRLNISQPAVSYALGKLRHQIGDPLLVKVKTGVAPTERALAIIGPVRTALETIQRAVASTTQFNPATSNITLQIGSVDYAGQIVLPQLVSSLLKQAPHMRYRIARVGLSTEDTVDAAHNCDMVFTLRPTVRRPLRQQALLADRMVVVAGANHPAIGKRLTLKNYLELPHVVTAPSPAEERTYLDEHLASLRLTRNVAVVLPHTLFVPLVGPNSLFIATVPELIAHGFAKNADVRLYPPPLQLPPISLSIVWHERFHDSAAHQWLRAQTLQICEDIAAENRQQPSARKKSAGGRSSQT